MLLNLPFGLSARDMAHSGLWAFGSFVLSGTRLPLLSPLLELLSELAALRVEHLLGVRIDSDPPAHEGEQEPRKAVPIGDIQHRQADVDE